MVAGPIRPIFDRAPHVTCPTGPLSVWFIDPPGAVVQLTEAAEFTESMARWLVGRGLELLRGRFADVPKLLIVLDVRPMTRRDSAVRTILMQKARDLDSPFSTVIVVPPLQSNPVYLTTLHAAAALVSAFGTRIEISGDVEHAMRRERVEVVS
jgi:hypothetical protein